MLNISNYMSKEKQIEDTKGTIVSFFKNDIVKGLLIALTSAILSQGLAYYFWTKQFQNNKAQKLLEFKIATYEKFANTITNAIYLSEGSIVMYIEEQKLLDITYDSIVKATGNKTINRNLKVWDGIQGRVQKRWAFYYEMQQKAMNTQNEFQASSLTMDLLFNSKVKNLADKLNACFQPEYSYNYFKKIRNETKLSPQEIKTKDIVISLINEKYTLRNLILDEMIKEIKN